MNADVFLMLVGCEVNKTAGFLSNALRSAKHKGKGVGQGANLDQVGSDYVQELVRRHKAKGVGVAGVAAGRPRVRPAA